MINKIISYSLLFFFLITTQITFAQCTDDTHSNNSKDAWVSCQTSTSPNSSNGTGHWVMYDLGYTYNLGATHFWNYNVAGTTEQGFKDIIVDYSDNGSTWTSAGQFQLPQASGNNNYTGTSGIDLSGITARYILLFAQSTWGNGTCAGLSEFKVDVNGTVLSTETLDFIATSQENHIELEWTIDAPTSIELERSTDAQHFEAIATLDVLNRLSDTYQDFQIQEGQPYYYRLKLFHEDGNISYSNIQEGILNKNLVAVKVFPNPVSQILNLDYGQLQLQEVIIHNASGHEIQRISNPLDIKRLDVASFPNGIYYLQLLTDKQQLISKRFVKVDNR